MGGGRSSTFSGTKGSDSYQETLFPDPPATRRRGKRHAFGDGPSGGAVSGMPDGVSASAGGAVVSGRRRILIGPEDVLEQCQRYRFGVISESKLVGWLQRVLDPLTYEIRPPVLRTLIQNGVIVLQSAQSSPVSCDSRKFCASLLNFEAKVERLLP